MAGTNLWLVTAGVVGAAGVALGAFGAHALESRLSTDMLAIYDTASRYHLVHAVALIGVAWVSNNRKASVWPNRAGWLLTAGLLVFSGSLYVLAMTGATWLGAVTPIGGLLMIAGWLAMALAARG